MVVMLAAIVLAAGAAAGSVWLGRSKMEPVEIYGTVFNFTLVERSGRRVTMADLRGKIPLVDFFSTRCHETCPLQFYGFDWDAISRMARVERTARTLLRRA